MPSRIFGPNSEGRSQLASELGLPRFVDFLTVSLTVVLGLCFAVDSLTNRPVIAERWRFPGIPFILPNTRSRARADHMPGDPVKG